MATRQTRNGAQGEAEDLMVDSNRQDRRPPPTREEIVDQIMDGIRPAWQHRWCDNGECGCMGCVNISFRAPLGALTKTEWEAWVVRNPQGGA